MASEDALSFGPGKDQGSSSKQLLDELLDEPLQFSNAMHGYTTVALVENR